MKTETIGEHNVVRDDNCLCFFRSKLFCLQLVKSKCLRLWSNRSLMRVGLFLVINTTTLGKSPNIIYRKVYLNAKGDQCKC